MYVAADQILWSRKHARWLQRVAEQLASSAVTVTDPSAFAKVERRICRALKLSATQLRSRSRSAQLVFARQAIAYWACRRTKLSMPEIGRKLSLDHTTVLHGRAMYPAKRKAMGRHLRALPGGKPA